MQRILHSDTVHILRFDSSDDVISGLQSYCENEDISAAIFSGLGASREITISYYNLAEKIYEDKTFSENLEITSLIGNIAIMGKKRIIHAHGVFGKRDYSALTGHVKKLLVSATCEIHLTVLNGVFPRAYDEVTGLNLLVAS